MNSDYIRFETFFSAIEKWRSQLLTSLDETLSHLKVARKKPNHAKFYPNIYLDDQGTPWIKEGDFWSSVHRVSDKPLASYRATLKHRIKPGNSKESLGPNGEVQFLKTKGGKQVVFAKRAGDHPKEDWGWDIHEGIRDPIWHYKNIEILTAAIVSGRKGLTFADTILSCQKQVVDWVNEYITTGTHRDEDRTLEAFSQEFSLFPITELPAETTKLAPALAAVFKQLDKVH